MGKFCSQRLSHPARHTVAVNRPTAHATPDHNRHTRGSSVVSLKNADGKLDGPDRSPTLLDAE